LEEKLDPYRFTDEGGIMARDGKVAAKPVRRACVGERVAHCDPDEAAQGGVVSSRKQAITIGLSEARQKGAKVPRKRRG
jgi:hypothetical protein